MFIQDTQFEDSGRQLWAPSYQSGVYKELSKAEQEAKTFLLSGSNK